MKNILKRIFAFSLVLCMLSGCTNSNSGPKKNRPTLDFKENLADSAVINTNGEKDIDFDISGEVVLEKGDRSEYKNFVYDNTKSAANVANLSISASGNNVASMIITKIVYADSSEKFIKVSIYPSENKAKLILFDDESSSVIEERELKDVSFDSSVMITTEYDNGITSAWIVDTCIFSYDASSLGTTRCFFGFSCEEGEATFKFMKAFGDIELYKFSLEELVENAKNLAASATYNLIFAFNGADTVDYAPCYIKNTTNNAARVELDNVDLSASDAFILRYKLTTYTAQEGYMGTRLTLFRDNEGNQLDLYQLQPSLSWYGMGEPYSYNYPRVLRKEEQFTFYCYNGFITVWLDDVKIFDNIKMPTTSKWNVDIGFLFEYTRADVTDIVLVKTDPLTIY